MSSFSCPHLDFKLNKCNRLQKDCIPGRTGCVLSGKVVFVNNENIQDQKSSREILIAKYGGRKRKK